MIKNSSILLILLILFTNSYPQELDSVVIKGYEKKINSNRDRADSLSNLISLGEDKIKELSKKENTQLEQLNEIEITVDINKQFLSELTQQSDSLAIIISRLSKSIDSLSALQLERHNLMINRLRQINKLGKPNIFEIILGADSPEAALRRIRFAQDLNLYDRNLLTKYDNDKIRLSTEEEMVHMQKVDLRTIRDAQIVQFEKVQKTLHERSNLLASIREEKSSWEASIKEMKQAQKELNSLVSELASKKEKLSIELERTMKIAFEKRKGKLPWPANGRIITAFGKVVHPEYKTVTTSNGIDIKGNNGDPVKSVAPGIVQYVGRMRGYGKFIIINHYGGYITIYAHLKKIIPQKDAEVSRGSKIGIIGESGSIEGTKLHFEIRKNSKTVNPIDWLSHKS